MNQPEIYSQSFPQLSANIQKGTVKIPNFQRDFVWTLDRSAMLLDSMLRGYPIGTFILWKTKERLRHLRDIGGIELPEPPKGDYVYYVLDGQQRLTSLFAAATGAKVGREGGRVDDFTQIWVNLNADEATPLVSHELPGEPGKTCISITSLLNDSFTTLAKFPEPMHPRLEEYQGRLKNYLFSIVTLGDVPLDVATEVFTRINVGGVTLSVFEIMVAKIYRPPSGDTPEFDLAREFAQLRERLAKVEYETVSPMILLYLVSALAAGDCRKKTILNLSRETFIAHWSRAVDGLERAIDYLHSAYHIPASRLLPYNALLVPLGFFFADQKAKPTSTTQGPLLKDFFFRASLTARYTGPVETNLGQDIDFVRRVLKGENPRLSPDLGVDITADLIRTHGHFRTSRAFIKAILCLMCAKGPRSFDDGSPVNIDNDWLKQQNSKNFHHFFPKAYIAKQGDPTLPEVNHIANITIVDEYLNKAKIGAQAPATYMRAFDVENKQLGRTMKTHLIDDLTGFGVWDNDYRAFFEKRCERIARELRGVLLSSAADDSASAAGHMRLDDDETIGDAGDAT